MIIVGFALTATCNFAMAVSFKFELNILNLVASFLYLIAFTTMTGPAVLSFCIEVNTDISLGLAMA